MVNNNIKNNNMNLVTESKSAWGAYSLEIEFHDLLRVSTLKIYLLI